MTPSDAHQAGLYADRLIEAEIALQDDRWGISNERADASDGQLMQAGMAQLLLLDAKQMNVLNPVAVGASFYPEGWIGLRDYGSDVANLVVAVAFLRQEIKRKIMAGEDASRLPRPEVA